MIIQKQLLDAIKDLNFIKGYKPYKFGGVWFYTEMNDKEKPYTIFYRTKKAILKTNNTKIYTITI